MGHGTHSDFSWVWEVWDLGVIKLHVNRIIYLKMPIKLTIKNQGAMHFKFKLLIECNGK